MTRNPKVDWPALEREYVYDSSDPGVSISQLAEKYGLSRTTVAVKAAGRSDDPSWFDRREQFRAVLGKKAVELLGEEWVRFETAAREKALEIAVAYMGKFEKALADPDFRVTTRDFLGVMSMMHTYLGEAAKAKMNGEEVLLDTENTNLDPDTARRVLEGLDRDAQFRLVSGGLDDDSADAGSEPGPAEAIAATGPAEPRED